MHFYTEQNGKVLPRHFVPMSSDPSRERPARISDAKKAAKNGEIWVPSVTTVLNVLDKAALTNWKIDRHLEQAYKKDVLALSDRDVSQEDYIAEVKRLTEIELDKAPSAGTHVHNSLENWALDETYPSDHAEIVKNVEQSIHDHCGQIKFLIPELHFASKEGYGGCVDLAFRADDEWIIDYKTKEYADKFKPGKMAYNDHRCQLAAYRQGTGRGNARCANVFICIETGEVDFHEHTEEELQHGWEIFRHALAIWQLQNNWHQFMEQAA